MTAPSFYWIRSLIPAHLYAYLTRTHIPFTVDFRKILIAKYLLKHGDQVIDGGAHVGYHTRVYSELVGKEGRVYSFEPNPYVFKILNKYTVTKKNIVAVQKALDTKANEKRVFYLNPRTLDQDSTLENRLKSKTHKPIEVLTTSIDTLLEKGLEKLKLIKLDVEGHELSVFEGGKAALQRFRPWIIFEYQKNETRDDGSLVSYLKDQSYMCFDLTTLKFFSGNEHSDLTDLLAVPQEHTKEKGEFLNSLKFYR